MNATIISFFKKYRLADNNVLVNNANKPIKILYYCKVRVAISPPPPTGATIK